MKSERAAIASGVRTLRKCSDASGTNRQSPRIKSLFIFQVEMCLQVGECVCYLVLQTTCFDRTHCQLFNCFLSLNLSCRHPHLRCIQGSIENPIHKLTPFVQQPPKLACKFDLDRMSSTPEQNPGVDLMTVDSGLLTILILLDLSVAFDTISRIVP